MRVIAAGIVLALVGAGPAAAAQSAPSALTAIARPAALHSAATKSPIATFGAGPANAKKPDGRSFFSYSTSAGGTTKDHIAILNLTHHVERLQVYTVDATPGADGGYSYNPKAAPRKAAGAWVAVGTPHGNGILRAKPRATTILPIHLTVPQGATPGDHVAGVVVSLTGLVRGKSGQRVHLDQRVATRVVVRVSGALHPQLSIEGLRANYSNRLNPVGGGTATVSYTVRNTGNVIIGGSQQISIHGLFGTTSSATKVPAIPAMLPGGTFRTTARVTGVFPEFRETAKVQVTPEALVGDVDPNVKPVTASVHFWAIPWVLIVILLLLILLAAIWRWRRRGPSPAESEGTTS